MKIPAIAVHTGKNPANNKTHAPGLRETLNGFGAKSRAGIEINSLSNQFFCCFMRN